jgi:hypothetical protein
MAVTANGSAQIIEAARIVQNILDGAKEDRAKHAVDGRLQYHTVANFLIKRSHVAINYPAPIGRYLFNYQKNSTLSRAAH